MADHFTWDARGNGDGKTACTIVGEHQNRVTDYTAIVLCPCYTLKIRGGVRHT